MHPASDVTSFGRVDDQSDPDYFVRFVDEVNAMPAMLELDDMALAELRLAAGDRALDLGCGAGDDSRRLAGLVGPTGSVIGVDASAVMIAAARERAEPTGLPVSFHVGDAAQLDLPTESFDGVRCERLLVHVPTPEAVIAEMVRVTRPGGRVVAIDIDFDGTLMDVPDLDRHAVRTAVHAMTDALAAGRIGRQLTRLFREAKLADVACRTALVPFPYDFARELIGGMLLGAVSAGSLTTDDSERLLAAMDRAERDGGLSFAMPFYIVSGTKP
jgi:ubiquinone/menaquinone biosynthesis C-methylase UbiE